AFYTCMEQSMNEVFVKDSAALESTNKVYEGLKAIFESKVNFLEIFTRLLTQAPPEDKFYKHAFSTSAFCYLIHSASGHHSKKTLEICIFASLFHDLGKKR